MIRVLIADNNVSLCDAVEQYLSSLPDFEVTGKTFDGEQALEAMRQDPPDAVILDITMPRLDGLGVLERMPELGLDPRPKVIVLTAFGRDDLIAQATRLGADYYMVKPFDMELLAARIRQFSGNDAAGSGHVGHVNGHSEEYVALPSAPVRRLGQSGPAQDAIQLVTEMIHQMGVPAHFKGYSYLRDAVLLVAEEQTALGGNLTKVLYPRIASKYNTSPGGVEAAIRNAIVTAWENGNQDYISSLVGKVAISTKNRLPSNSLIIAKLADRLRMALRSVPV